MTSSPMRCASKAASEAAAYQQQPETKLPKPRQQTFRRLLLLISSLQHPMLQVHVDIHVQLLHPQLRLRVVVPWTSTPN